MIRFDELAAGEGQRLRSIRLRALRDTPDAFGTTFEEASAHTAETWSKQVLELPTFVAVKDGDDVGLVRCGRDQSHVDTAWLISMWVAPEIRRTGVAAALVELVIEWARTNGVSRLLDVADENAPAIALYDRKGFKPNGEVGALPPPGQHIREHQRELRLV